MSVENGGRLTSYTVHKTRGTVKFVTIEASHICFERGGALTFWTDGELVMAYAPWAWKSCYPNEYPLTLKQTTPTRPKAS